MIEYFEISLLISLAALLGLLANKLKQPPLLGYIIAGVIIGLLGIFSREETEKLELFSKIGITFLLFILGLELNPNELKKLGKTVLITGIAQIIITTIIGFILSLFQGFGLLPSVYLATALTFSSTIVIVKLLSTKNEINTLHGKISIGFLLVQDFAAILILISLTSLGGSPLEVLGEFGRLILKLPLLFGISILMSKFVLPWLIKETKHDREVLFLLIIGWALLFASIVSSKFFGFSTEIGALLAGITLSTRKEHLQIESWTKSLRDFFVTVFFVLLGLNIDLHQISSIIVPSVIFSIFVLIGNPIILMFIIGVLGYNKRVNFLTSLNVAQISEFSLLLGAMGYSLGHLSGRETAILTLVGGVTMALSSYLIYYNQQLYGKLKNYLKIFEFTSKKLRGAKITKYKDHVVIFGFHRIGFDLFDIVISDPKKYIVVDHNPKTIEMLSKERINVVYGDMHDDDIYPSLFLNDAKLIVSTVPVKSANMELLRYLALNQIEVPTVVTASTDDETKELYRSGAIYVVYAHLRSSSHLRKIIESEIDINKINQLAKREIGILDHRTSISEKII